MEIMKSVKPVIVIMLLAATMAISFGMPKSKYRSPDILSKLSIPARFSYWNSKDVSNTFNPNDLRYNFISRIFARYYENKYGESLLFLILDAGNFHNPKICYGASGYKTTDLPAQQFRIKDKIIKANAVFFQKPAESYVIIYWIVIDKKIVNWTGQKLLELWYALFNKQKVGLMVRLDIPATPNTIDSALKLAKEFISQISSELPFEQSEFIFGK